MEPAARERRQAVLALFGGCLIAALAAGGCVYGLLRLGQPESSPEPPTEPWSELFAELPRGAGRVVVAVRRTNRVDRARDRELRVVTGPHAGKVLALPWSPGGRNWLNLYFYPAGPEGAFLVFVDSYGSAVVDLAGDRVLALCRVGEKRRAFPIQPRLSPCQQVRGSGESVPERLGDLSEGIYVGRFDEAGTLRFVPAAEAVEEPRRPPPAGRPEPARDGQ